MNSITHAGLWSIVLKIKVQLIHAYEVSDSKEFILPFRQSTLGGDIKSNSLQEPSGGLNEMSLIVSGIEYLVPSCQCYLGWNRRCGLVGGRMSLQSSFECSKDHSQFAVCLFEVHNVNSRLLLLLLHLLHAASALLSCKKFGVWCCMSVVSALERRIGGSPESCWPARTSKLQVQWGTLSQKDNVRSNWGRCLILTSGLHKYVPIRAFVPARTHIYYIKHVHIHLQILLTSFYAIVDEPIHNPKLLKIRTIGRWKHILGKQAEHFALAPSD